MFHNKHIVYPRQVPTPNSPAHEFYEAVMTKTMDKMEERLKANGFDVDQIDSFKNLWREKCYEMEQQSDEETEEAQYQQPEQYAANDLYSRHLTTLHNQPMNMNVNVMNAQPMQQFQFAPSQQIPPEYHDSFLQQEKPLMMQPEPIQQQPTPQQKPPQPPQPQHHTNEDVDGDALSDDDDDDELSEEPEDHDALLICLFMNVRHAKSRHRCEFVNCVLRYKHREYFFVKCNAEFASP
ncbi:hypothetical protein EIN_152140 [Entamoeba invadens IP1]|uniref:Uncharacterized protein n=1 Tax=Entamoeba invadens IP1 TaxID=370355 RepID=A0A0A1U8T6_ENTIV|nr:hypothetical protein EIN_152140 [Entamoeba invadens IP1]ELP91257.1 hypothetical protein EIN_152140 [Entamoeba invadens IP1]|eukprot:XP_004258028.1 hypothetical protein EIN_152140 [Entamoeba invadens IP1]